MSCSSVGLKNSLHFEHTRRTRRCAMIASIVAVRRNVSTPRSTRRRIVLGASLVCSVVSTRWPVSEAWMAICAVSRSRISPTRMMSGSCRRKLRSSLAKVSSCSMLTWHCTRPCTSYSTGSSAVRILTVMSLSSLSAAYSVVVLPEPVGPVTMQMPLGLLVIWRTSSRSSSRRPTLSSESWTLERSSTRSTTDSPNIVGSTATRRSTGASPRWSSMRPSCGSRRSAMSSLDMTLTRETSAVARPFGIACISYSTPSMR